MSHHIGLSGPVRPPEGIWYNVRTFESERAAHPPFRTCVRPDYMRSNERAIFEISFWLVVAVAPESDYEA